MVNYSIVGKNKSSGILQNPTCNSNLTPPPPPPPLTNSVILDNLLKLYDTQFFIFFIMGKTITFLF